MASETVLDPLNISGYLRTKVPSHMIPTSFRRIERFIETANGKIDRKRIFECKEIGCSENKAQIPDALSSSQKDVLSVIASRLDVKLDDITFDTGFADIGLDSLRFIQLIVALEEEFKFEFEDEALLATNYPDVGSMIKYVESKKTTVS